MSRPDSDPRQVLFDGLEAAADGGVFPGCVALVWVAGAIVYHEAHGVLATHEAASVCGDKMARDTVFDLASLTKVLCTTTLVAIAVERGRLELDQPVPAPWSAACPGATLADLLEHCSGLAAHREYFCEVAPFSAAGVVERVIATPPAYPLRTKAVYSDLGFIILGAWLEQVFAAPLDVAFADNVAYRLGLDSDPELPAVGFRRLTSHALVASRLAARIAPTEVYCEQLHPAGAPSYLPVRRTAPCAHGVVHDDNAFVMGGVAGHAGMFGTAAGVLEIARAWLEGELGFDVALCDRFWRPSATPGSTRRLGFDGPDPDGSGAGGHALGPDAVGHTGFTGTSVWIDPRAAGGSRISVLLANRVHPVRQNAAIRAFRRRFHAWAARL